MQLMVFMRKQCVRLLTGLGLKLLCYYVVGNVKLGKTCASCIHRINRSVRIYFFASQLYLPEPVYMNSW